MKNIAIALALVAFAGCGKKNDGDASKKTAEPEKTKEPEKTPDKPKEVAKTPDKPKETPAPAGVKIDPEIAKRVKAIVDNCKVDPASNSISDCKNGEDNEIFNYANTNKDKATGLFESLAEIASTDGAKDPKVLVAVVETWPGFSDRESTKKASTPAAAERIIKLYDKVNPGSYRWVNASFPVLAAGKHAELAAALAKLPEDKAQLRQSAYAYFLDYGGIDALADMQAVVKDDKASARDKAAAFQSVGLAVHDNGLTTDADKAKACDWVKDSLEASQSDVDVYRGALDSLSRCGSAYIDIALASMEANVKAKHLTLTVADELHHMCWAEGTVGGTMNGSKEQCAKAFAILEAGINDKDTDKAGLSQSVFVVEMLGKNSPDLKAKATALLTKLAGNPDKNVADSAKRDLEELKKAK